MHVEIFAVILLLTTWCVGSPLPPVPAKCERYTSCNGEMCDQICKIGTVEVDPWATKSLAFQRQIQFNRSILLYEMVGTHNGAIVQDYAMGIEEKFLKNLLLPIYGAEKSEVVIANQRHSMLDQLRMGVRHIEIDLYYFARLGGIRICHWPVFPPDFVLIVNNAAKQQGLDPLDWEPGNMGCDLQKPFFEDKLKEISSWLQQAENRQEFVGIYIDNKNMGTNRIQEFTDIVLRVLGDTLFTPEQKKTEYPNRWPSVLELIQKNRRVYIEQNDNSWVGQPLADKYFFTPTPWVQFGPNTFGKYPACTINGVNYYNQQFTRSLDGSLTLGPAFLWEGRSDYPVTTIADMARCSMNIQSLDQIHPDVMQHFVWSWERDQPTTNACASIVPGGRWRSQSCTNQLSHACVSNSNELEWALGSVGSWGSVTCPSGYSFGFPVTGFINSKLAERLNGQQVWINYRT